MRYYNNHPSCDEGISWNVKMIFICIAIIFAVIFGHNTCAASEWNDGSCPECSVRYELRGVGRYGLRYYACPECEQVVSIYE